MILVDTSIWVDHLRAGVPQMHRLLDRANVLTHPWVIGEIALGHVTNRAEIMRLLAGLPHALSADDDEVLGLIERESLHGQGIGYVDVHLLAATLLTPDTWLWTRDRRLAGVADRLGCAA